MTHHLVSLFAEARKSSWIQSQGKRLSPKHEDETNKVEEIIQRKIDKIFGERRTQVGTYNGDRGLN